MDSQVVKKRRGRGKPFTKGDPRINPGGLSKEARAFHDQYRDALIAELNGRPHGEEKTYFEQGIEKLVKDFAAGKQWAQVEVIDRLVGKPRQTLEATGLGGLPVAIVTNVQMPPK